MCQVFSLSDYSQDQPITLLHVVLFEKDNENSRYIVVAEYRVKAYYLSL